MPILRPLTDMSRTTDRRGDRGDSVRAVVVDDSPFMRGLIADLLTDAGVSVVGEAGDGTEALSVVAETRPDVVTMDVEMPGMGGLEAVERLMEETPTPVLMLSAHTAEGASITFEALERGAVDFFSKPGGEVSTGVSRESDRLVEAVKSVAGADLAAATRDRRERERRSGSASRSASTDASGSSSGTKPGATARSTESTEVAVDGPLTVVIAASTGGPNAVERVMAALPMADCRVVIVQHMPEAFTPRFAERLDDASAYDVREASDGARIGAGEALVAPGGSHTRIDSYRAGRLRVKLDTDDSQSVTPAADITMRSAAEVVDGPLVGVVLTGMGSDAAEGIRAMANAGARTLAQSEDTCVIYGMPKRAVETGGVGEVHDLNDVAGAIVGGEA
jgi:two-component system chemotaxis response regulator CheB